MRLSHLVPTGDWAWQRRVAHEALSGVVKGLPSHMQTSVTWCAKSVLANGTGVDYLYLCLLVAQARPGGESAETVLLRKELESIFADEVYGGPA